MKLAALYWEETDKMKQFMDKDFLLDTATAKHLFHDYAEHMPIIDYHCHISPQEIAEDHHFRSITEVWLGGDHYKWRLIRSNGFSVSIPETGRLLTTSFRITSSTYVFHSPHDGHLPTHFGDSCPQLLHT